MDFNIKSHMNLIFLILLENKYNSKIERVKPPINPAMAPTMNGYNFEVPSAKKTKNNPNNIPAREICLVNLNLFLWFADSFTVSFHATTCQVK